MSKDSIIYRLNLAPSLRAVDSEPVTLGKRAYYTKDILSVGKWCDDDSWDQPWIVTPETLTTIVKTFQAAKKAGIDVGNVVMVTGSVEDQHAENAANKIGEVESLAIEGERLVARLWVESASNPEVYRLSAKNQKVSVDVRDPWRLNGAEYPLFLKHVAIVTHPVATGQGPFVRQLSKVKKQMAKDKELAAEGDNTFTIDEVKEMLAKAGFKIPDVATSKESVMAAFLMAAGEEETAEEQPPMPADQAAAVVADPTASPKQMSKAAKTIYQAYNATIKQLAAIESAEKQAKKERFCLAVGKAVESGKLTPANKDVWLKAGEKAGYTDDLLGVIDTLPVQSGGGVARKLAAGKTEEGKESDLVAARQKELAARVFST